MDSPFLLATLLTTCILSGAFLALSPIISRTRQAVLHHFYLALGAFALCIFGSAFLIFSHTQQPIIYKLYLCWGMPFCCFIAYMTMGRPFLEQLFCYSMLGLVEIVIHTVAVFLYDIEKLYLPAGLPNLYLMSLHCCNYLMLFTPSLPFLQRFFRRILPPERFFHYHHLGLYLTLLPCVAVLGVSLQYYDNVLIHDLHERISRLFLPILLFILYRLIIITGNQLSEEFHKTSHTQKMELQLAAIENYTNQINEQQRGLSILRHDMRHYDSMLTALLKDGNIRDAQELIAQHGAAVSETRTKSYCQQPLVNATLSIYLRRIEEAGIPLQEKINLPRDFPTKTAAEVSILLANLIENAYHACLKLPKEQRSISLTLQTQEASHVLMLENSYDGRDFLGPDGLPHTNVPVHGTGTDSLRRFIARHEARTRFELTKDRVHCYIYWSD